MIAWLQVRKALGQILFRMEDLDTPRIKSWAFDQAIEDLQWLGLDWDFGPASPPKEFRLVQSERMDRYGEILDQLRALNCVYPCTCSRSDIENAQSAPHESHWDAPIYPGTCSHRCPEDAKGLAREGRSFAWRFRIPPGARSWHDQFQGEQSSIPSKSIGDFVVARANGMPAYQLAVVVDDHDMKITDVVRGDDLIASTFRQQLLYEALDWPMPRMSHLPLVVGPDGRRLAKRHGDTRLSSLRQAGIDPRIVIGYLAYQSRMIEEMAPLAPKDLVARFDINLLPKQAITLAFPDQIAFFQKLAADGEHRD